MEIRYLERNKTYTSPQRIRPVYVAVHSTGSGVTNRTVLFNAWNNPGVKLSCHAMVDDEGWTLTLPLDYKGWHVGSRGNGLCVGFEICEPPFIRYADDAHTRIDLEQYNPKDARVLADFKKRWANAVDCAAYMCRESGIMPEHVLCHAELFAIERATNHADVLHWFPLFGDRYGMDYFRAAVKAALQKPKATAKTVRRARRRTVEHVIN